MSARAIAGVLGLGVDLTENARMRATLKRWNGQFKSRVFRPAEQRYCDACSQPWRHYAGRFAVKEAISKAFGTGIGEALGWLDIEVVRGAAGAPTVKLHDAGARLARRRGVQRILISLSHTRHYAVAQALLVGRENGGRA
ncbi:MAG: holo-[acyl-carrier-protein] synthase [Verrucomicrobia bacterium]|nr:MAG: holo-[acyl-carrier-protein] synthase [Verrucomicrobiota bacterium]